MKRVLSLLMVITLLIAMVGCSSNPTANSSSTPAAASSSAPAATPAESKSATEEKPMKVALLIPGNLGDKSFFDMANAGIELVKKEVNHEVKVVEMGTDQTKWEPTLRDFAEQDWDLIITGTWEISEMLVKIAKEYPDKKFMNFDTAVEDVTPNLYSAFYLTNEHSYLAGIIAALKAKELGESTIGFIGGMDNPGINDFLIGYIEGAQKVNKDIKVAISYVGSFIDAAKGKEQAIAMYNSGVGIIYQVAGQTGLGVIDAAKELKKLVIGVDSDQAATFMTSDPDKANYIVTSAVKKIDQCILRAVKQHKEGSLYGKHEALGIQQQGVGLAKNSIYDSKMTSEQKTFVDEIEAKVSSGEIKITTALGMTTEQVEKIRASVRP